MQPRDRGTEDDSRPTVRTDHSLVRVLVRNALRNEWMRSIREQIEDSPDGHVERMTHAVMVALGMLSEPMCPCATNPMAACDPMRDLADGEHRPYPDEGS